MTVEDPVLEMLTCNRSAPYILVRHIAVGSGRT